MGLWNETVAKIEDGDQEPNQEVPVQISVLKNRNGVAGVKAYLQLLRPALKLKDQKSIEVH